MKDFEIRCDASHLEISSTNNSHILYGKFTLGPFLPGQGTTFGNALRRSLLSELSGLAITAFEILGIMQEFSTLPGLRESILDLSLNLKQVVLTGVLPHSIPPIGFLKRKGPAIIRAMDLKLPAGVYCTSPDQYIATLSSNGDLNLKFLVSVGKGYSVQPYSLYRSLSKIKLQPTLEVLESHFTEGKTLYPSTSEGNIAYPSSIIPITSSTGHPTLPRRGRSTGLVTRKAKQPEEGSQVVHPTTHYPEGASEAEGLDILPITRRACLLRKPEGYAADSYPKGEAQLRSRASSASLPIPLRASVITRKDSLHTEGKVRREAEDAEQPTVQSTGFGVRRKRETEQHYSEDAPLGLAQQQIYKGVRKNISSKVSNNKSINRFQKNLSLTSRKNAANKTVAYPASFRTEGKAAYPNPEGVGQQALYPEGASAAGVTTDAEVHLSGDAAVHSSDGHDPNLLVENKKCVNIQTQIFQRVNPHQVLPIDAVFTPVSRVNFLTQVNDRFETARENIVLEIWTNGSIHPKKALEESTLLLVQNFDTLLKKIQQASSISKGVQYRNYLQTQSDPYPSGYTAYPSTSSAYPESKPACFASPYPGGVGQQATDALPLRGKGSPSRGSEAAPVLAPSKVLRGRDILCIPNPEGVVASPIPITPLLRSPLRGNGYRGKVCRPAYPKGLLTYPSGVRACKTGRQATDARRGLLPLPITPKGYRDKVCRGSKSLLCTTFEKGNGGTTSPRLGSKNSGEFPNRSVLHIEEIPKKKNKEASTIPKVTMQRNSTGTKIVEKEGVNYFEQLSNEFSKKHLHQAVCNLDIGNFNFSLQTFIALKETRIHTLSQLLTLLSLEDKKFDISSKSFLSLSSCKITPSSKVEESVPEYSLLLKEKIIDELKNVIHQFSY